MTQICTKTTLVSKQAKDGIHTELFFYQKQRAQENVVNFSRQMSSKNRFLHDKTNIHSYQLVYFCKTLKQSIHMHTYLKHLKTVQQQTYMHSYQMNLSQ